MRSSDEGCSRSTYLATSLHFFDIGLVRVGCGSLGLIAHLVPPPPMLACLIGHSPMLELKLRDRLLFVRVESNKREAKSSFEDIDGMTNYIKESGNWAGRIG